MIFATQRIQRDKKSLLLIKIVTVEKKSLSTALKDVKWKILIPNCLEK